MKINPIILLSMIFITACTQVGDIPTEIECTTASDCAPAGCSSQLCVTKEEAPSIITTCEFKLEYECLELTNCGCINNKCQWEGNPDYSECLDNL